uniref:Fibrinogen silencer binding protein n=1 Tax=Leptobrachium leishanense TaxID=445787 RepID=A0A8C5PXP2_9ANUR
MCDMQKDINHGMKICDRCRKPLAKGKKDGEIMEEYKFSDPFDVESKVPDTDPTFISQHIPLHDQVPTVMVQLEQEEDVKPPPSLLLSPQPVHVLEETMANQEFEHESERSLSPSISSVDIRLSLSPPLPRIEECFSHAGERGRAACSCNPETLQMAKKEHELNLSNQRQYGLYIKEKREGLKRRQHLEEELLKAKIKVEKLKAIKLRRDLPEYSNL